MKEKTEFSRICPECGGVLYYSTLKCRRVADKFNRVCYGCSQKGDKNNNYGKMCPEHVKEILRQTHKNKIVSEETRRKRSISLSGEKNPNYGLTGSLSPHYGIPLTKDHKNKLSEIKIGKPISQHQRERIGESRKGKKHSIETKRKMRLTAIKNIIEKNGSIAPRYNIEACKFFDKMENEKKWNGLYATKNGEFYIKDLGYFVDYYEPSLNLIVEYDESNHYNIDNTLKKRDKDRMLEIINRLKCQFYRYNERTGKLKKYE